MLEVCIYENEDEIRNRNRKFYNLYLIYQLNHECDRPYPNDTQTYRSNTLDVKCTITSKHI